MEHMSTSQTNVQILNFNEPSVVQMNTIISLQSSLGLDSSRDIVERAAFEVSDRLGRLEISLMEGDLQTTSKIASGLVSISQQIGLEKFAGVAEDLMDAVDNNDYVAIAAISNRLKRQGENALYDAINFQDDPIYS